LEPDPDAFGQIADAEWLRNKVRRANIVENEARPNASICNPERPAATPIPPTKWVRLFERFLKVRAQKVQCNLGINHRNGLCPRGLQRSGFGFADNEPHSSHNPCPGKVRDRLDVNAVDPTLPVPPASALALVARKSVGLNLLQEFYRIDASLRPLSLIPYRGDGSK
jgi:hypothetical protein